MILIITRTFDPHADRVIELLNDRHAFLRFNVDRFPAYSTLTWSNQQDTLRAAIESDGRTVSVEDITVGWYRRTSRPTVSADVVDAEARQFAERQSASALLYYFDSLPIRWINRPSTVAKANNKLSQLLTASAMGMRVPRTLVTNSPLEAAEFYRRERGAVITKVLSQSGLEDMAIYTQPVSASDAQRFETVSYAPVLLQESIAKDYELRVTVVGNKVFAVAIYSQVSHETTHDWRRQALNTAGIPHLAVSIPERIETLVRDYLRNFDLQYGAFDFVVTPEGDYVFLELNPSGQWMWLERLTDVRITEELVRLLQSF